MKKEEFYFDSRDGESSIHGVRWMPDRGEAKGIIQVIHGMEEYQDRYESFAEYLREAGYTVVTADLRGHGKNAPVLSHIADKEGHLRLLEDEEVILDEIHGRWPGMPVILFGHRRITC